MARRSADPRLATKLLPTDARTHNRTLVIQTVLRSRDVSRADVARITGLSRITVSELVAGLVSDGIIVETGSRATAGRPGKPATLLAINPDVFTTIAVDLSQPGEFHGSLLALDGSELRHAVVDGNVRGDGAVAQVLGLVAQLADSTAVPIGGIGIGTPGIVDDSGVVLESTNLGWRRLALAEIVRERFSVPTRVENDANAAIVSELDPQHNDDLLLVRVGAGLGGAAFVGGQLVRGASFAAGEFAHVHTAPATDESATVEESVQSLLRTTDRLRDQLPDHPEAAALLEATQRQIGALIGQTLTPAVAMLDVPRVIIDGPRELDVAIIAEAAQTAIRDQRSLVSGRLCAVMPGANGPDAVLLGMAGIVRSLAVAAL
ncbi:ROK family transcriptional regulator [Microbacterium halotolerans]|uniref:ROK family transcriptional regulator n=1 Tax=Microbacterium halotolerans TaxID=246613 RepID=UPI0013C33408|nr:ROK family protein [Microbacterium halotolerans]